MKLLRIDSSAREKSVSRQLTEAFVAARKERYPDGEVVNRNVVSLVVPAITDVWVAAARTDPAKRTSAELEALALSDELIGELEAADIILIGAPMYNFAISAPLKAWIDQIVRPGRTVEYGAQGPKGLLEGKKVVVLTARGGAYSDGAERSRLDYQEPYLRAILAFIGLTDVTFIHAENQLRRDQAELAREAALKKINDFVGLIPWGSMGRAQIASTSDPTDCQTRQRK